MKDEKIVVTRRQIELAIYIRQYRRINNLSQVEMARLCCIYGEPYGIKVSPIEISNYENYRHMPRGPKFQILLNTMDLSDI